MRTITQEAKGLNKMTNNLALKQPLQKDNSDKYSKIKSQSVAGGAPIVTPIKKYYNCEFKEDNDSNCKNSTDCSENHYSKKAKGPESNPIKSANKKQSDDKEFSKCNNCNSKNEKSNNPQITTPTSEIICGNVNQNGIEEEKEDDMADGNEGPSGDLDGIDFKYLSSLEYLGKRDQSAALQDLTDQELLDEECEKVAVERQGKYIRRKVRYENQYQFKCSLGHSITLNKDQIGKVWCNDCTE